MAVFYEKILLDKLIFDYDTSTFILGSDELSDTFSVSYVPNKEYEEFDINEYELFVFESTSLVAENDVFLIHETELGKDIGWLFPLSTLESNENDYSGKVFFNQFRFCAYQKILSKSFSLKENILSKRESFLLSDLFNSDLIIVLIEKNELTPDSNFEILKYLPSFANYGYFIKNDHKLKYVCPNNLITNKFRGKKKIHIQKTKNQVYTSNFTKKLYTNYLKTLDHHLIRFHLLYQVIEYHITELFNTDFDKLLDDYNNRTITKNNFIDKLNTTRKERENVRKVLKGVNPNDSTFEKDMLINLKRDCNAFISEFGEEEKNELGDLIYDTRNLIVHNYREITDEKINLLNEITFEFEIIINYIITNSP